ncbi:hypothetical protein QAD02_018981 [Eretmocerus hayati]|uniref:Uncharacterized protein n=1 Tax=Eretmocerus hayati TaxID=131215 RepID=A0ACC2PIR1_9HYME|nr:hypothetical protein QAD02_018981 [Eretmocerus hayati]
MEDLSDPNLDPSSTFDYDEDHDSDVEARLYAEIHYSNTIIGEEDHEAFSTQSEKSTKEVETRIVDQFSKDNVDRSTPNPKSLESKSNHKVMKSNSTRKSSEPHSGGIDVDDSSNPCKKRKKQDNEVNEISIQDQTETVDTDKSKKFGLEQGNGELALDNENNEKKGYTDNMTVSDFKKNLLIVNPGSPKLLENYEKKSAKKSKNLTSGCFGLSDDENEKCILETSSRKINNMFDKPLEKHAANRHSKQSTSVGERTNNPPSIIDLTVESVTEVEKESKYSTFISTNEKVERKESQIKNLNAYNPMSDDEASIFEVPVPPKPAPPIIELKDSDVEQVSDSDDDNSSDESVIDLIEESMNKSNRREQVFDTSVVYDIDSDSNDHNEIVLNCTQVQKSAISLDEIRDMSHQEVSNEESSNEMGTASVLKDVQGNHQLANSKASLCKSQTNGIKEPMPVQKKIPIEEEFFQPMTNKMKSFYNDSWGGENFDIDELKKQMSSDPKKWYILADDLALLGRQTKRYFGIVCSRCHKNGHRTQQCPETFKMPVCHMCGAAGHRETACPHKTCLSCGKKSNMYRKTCGYCERFTCTRCKSYGHLQETCPDLWRRYHHTIKNLAADIPTNIRSVMKPQRELSCCNCAKRGHDSYSCHKLRWSQHFPNPSNVANYNGPAYTLSDDCRSKRPCLSPVESRTVMNETPRLQFEKPNRPNVVNSNSYKYVNQDMHARQLVEQNEKIIFKVLSDDWHKQKLDEKVIVKVDCNKDDISSYENWKPLSEFLSSLTKRISATFSATHIGRKINVYGDCSAKYYKTIVEIIKQFAYRSSSERSYVYLKFDLSVGLLHQQLNNKLSEMKKVEDDALELYEELKRLKLEVIKSNVQNSDDLRNSLRHSKMKVCLKKLLMILYREGFADQSLKNLRKLSSKLSMQLQQNITDTSVSLLLKYIYSYNNVFVSHEPRTLSAWIKDYEDHVRRYNRLKDNPLFNPSFKEHLNSQLTDGVTTYSNTSTEGLNPLLVANNASSSKMSSDLSVTKKTSKECAENPGPDQVRINPQPMSGIIPESTVNTSTSNIINPVPLMAIPIQRPKVTNKKGGNNVVLEHSREKYSEFYLHSLLAKTEKKKQKALQRFRFFIQVARGCLEEARKLDTSKCPKMRRLINAFENKLKNEIFLKQKDLNFFRKNLRAEKAKLRQKKSMHNLTWENR